MKKNRKKASSIYGVQIKYTIVPLMILNFVIVAVLLLMFCSNLFRDDVEVDIPSFVLLLSYLPLAPAFWLGIIGAQAILSVGFIKQQRDSQKMLRVPMSQNAILSIRCKYSLLVTLAEMMVHFLTLGGLYLIYEVGTDVVTCGSIDLYLSFYKFRYLINMYPFANPSLITFTITAIFCASLMSMEILVGKESGSKGFIAKVLWLLIWFSVLCSARSIGIKIFAAVIVIFHSVLFIVKNVNWNCFKHFNKENKGTA